MERSNSRLYGKKLVKYMKIVFIFSLFDRTTVIVENVWYGQKLTHYTIEKPHPIDFLLSEKERYGQ